MRIEPHVQVADVATAHPAAIRVFQRHGIDFCCGGKKPLRQACAEAKVSYDQLASDLQAALAQKPGNERSWTDAPLTELTDHIVARYHTWLREELPRLGAMAEKVARVHGERHPEVLRVHEVFLSLRDDLLPHMMKEEQVLFPYLRQMDALRTAGRLLPASPFGTVGNPIAAMEAEHETVGDLIGLLREVTGGFEPPADACNTYRGLYHGLGELERELHEHIHLENNVQFPRAVALEEQLRTAAIA